MPVNMISEDVIRIALDKAEGFVFERFANAFYAALIGATFAPLGGVRDGGADARDVDIFEDDARRESFYQASVEVDAEKKIRATVKRLREFGRDPKILTYLTSRTVKYTDRIERALGDELDVTVQIRDANYIVAHINTDDRTRHAFDQYLRHYTDFLRQVGTSRLIAPSRHVTSPAVYVFLANEIDRRGGNESLVDSVTDALALWALEGTDPDNRRTAEEVLDRILSQVPSVRTLVEPRLQRRLEVMSRKSYPGGRAVRWHQHEGGFCLPHEVRERIEAENIADEALRLRVLDSLDGRLRAAPPPEMTDADIRAAAEVALRSLQLVFEREGLEFAKFLDDRGTGEIPTVTEALKDAVAEAGHTGRRGSRIQEGAFVVLRGVLYDSRPEERDYLHRLSRTYALLFTLNTEPRLLEFFQEMTGDFRLYVGADQIVMALSEHYLPEADQITRNTLKMAVRLGAKLILTEPALEEVVGNLRGADHEYANHVKAVEHRLDFQFAREAPKIMLRAYLYARLADGDGVRRRPTSWEAFVGQFVSHRTLHRVDAYDDMRGYLQTSFGLAYESAQQLEDLVDAAQVEALAEQLAAHKDPRLAPQRRTHRASRVRPAGPPPGDQPGDGVRVGYLVAHRGDVDLALHPRGRAGEPRQVHHATGLPAQLPHLRAERLRGPAGVRVDLPQSPGHPARQAHAARGLPRDHGQGRGGRPARRRPAHRGDGQAGQPVEERLRPRVRAHRRPAPRCGGRGRREGRADSLTAGEFRSCRDRGGQVERLGRGHE